MIDTIPDIIYFHGLNSELSEDKRKVLEEHGKVTGHLYNYRRADVLHSIDELFENQDPMNKILIGSSFGGYIANSYSMVYNIPCLLFNPALVNRSADLKIPQPFDKKITGFTYIVLGRKDEVINCEENAAFIRENLQEPNEIIIEESLGHRIPMDIFEKHVRLFFNRINLSKLTPG